MDTQERIGARVAARRKLAGMTGRQLADTAAVSYSLLSKVESGAVPASPAFTAAVARALGVGVATLTGQPYQDETPQSDRVHQGIPQIRREATVYKLAPTDGEHVAARDLTALRQDVAESTRLRQAGRYGRLVTMLPGLLAELRAAMYLAKAPEKSQIFRLLAAAYDNARALTHQLGYTDLTAILVDRYEWAAAQSDDPLAICVGDTMRSAELTSVGEYAAAAAIVGGSLTRLGSVDLHRANPETISIWGYLHLQAALAMARAGNAVRAWEAHDEAARAANALGSDRNDYRLAFGPTNVGIWSVGLAVELCDHQRALTNAGRVRLPTNTVRVRASHHHIDLSRGWLYHGDRQQALACLLTARRIAPQYVRSHPQVRETLHALARSERRTNGTLREFASWAGIDD